MEVNIIDKSSIIIYQTSDGQPKIEVHFEGNIVWLTQEQIAKLYGKGISTIAEHLQNIFLEGELEEKVLCRNFQRTTPHGAIKNKTQDVSVKQYNLDIIIAIGYREKSPRGTHFRIWATQIFLLNFSKKFKTKIPMKMTDWVKHLDGILTSTGEKLQKTLSHVEQIYLDHIININNKIK